MTVKQRRKLSQAKFIRRQINTLDRGWFADERRLKEDYWKRRERLQKRYEAARARLVTKEDTLTKALDTTVRAQPTVNEERIRNREEE